MGRDTEEGGRRFVPRGGNVLFWVNLLANRTGHAGLPLLEERKKAMNISPRTFYGRGVRLGGRFWVLLESSSSACLICQFGCFR